MTVLALVVNNTKQQEQEREYVKADTDNGYYRVANELGLALCKVQLSDRESRIIQAIMVKTFGWQKSTDWICNDQLSELTNIGITHISNIKKTLKDRNIMIVDGRKVGINPIVSDWILLKKDQNKNNLDRLNKTPKQVSRTPKQVKEVTQTGAHKRKTLTTKDTITKDTSSSGSKIAPDLIKNLFNEKLPVLQKVLSLNANRKNLIKARQKDLPTIQHWNDYFEKIGRSSFLTGLSSDWKASFDWILKDSNCLKILEGNYDNKPSRVLSKSNVRASVSEHNQQAMDEWIASKQPEIEVNP
jgi:phage replication O-like protein O